MAANISTAPVIWRPPFRGNSDKAIRMAFEEFLRRKNGNTYQIGEAIAFLSGRVPQIRKSGLSPNKDGQANYDAAWQQLRKLRRVTLPPRNQY
jgi:hypothetical protein